MISKITENNKELIIARIKEINEAFKAKAYKDAIAGGKTEEQAIAAQNDALQIEESLESYYANITEIAKLSTDFGPTGHKAPYRFLLMPLDEPIFEIDANKRTITVPQAFNKNGIGVRGDHKAEVLYFKIDKYFDYKDLFNVDAIIINWQFRPANASRNAEFPVETSVALAPDDTYEEGHIVFGWVITNEMTPSKGTLSFSVSFLMRTGGTYNYLLSTQIASVSVNDTLMLEDPTILDSLKAPTFERLSDSRYTPENLTPLLDPIFRTGVQEREEDSEGKTQVVFRGLERVANFAINPDDGTEDSALTLSAIGMTKDDGGIQYRWSWVTHDPEESGWDEEPRPAKYIVSKDTTPVAGVQYYHGLENGTPVPITSEDNKAAIFADPNDIVYEVGSDFEVTKGGEYLVSIQSTKTVTQSSGNVTIKSGNVDSCTCSVPKAAIPAVELTVAGISPAEGAYEIYDEALAEGYTFIEGSSTPTITATISKDESKIYDAASGEGVLGVSANSEIGAIALKLTNAEGDSGKPQASEFADMTFKVKDEKPGKSYALTKDGGVFPVDSASANGEGVYKVYAVNRRNHTYGVSDASNILKVSAIAPQLTGIKIDVLHMPDAVEEGEEQTYSDITLIDNNVKRGEAKLEITSADASRDFALTIMDDLSGLVDEVIIEPTLYEIDHEKYERDQTIAYLNSDEGSASKDIPNVYDMVVDPENPQRFTFTLNNDPGYFIAQVVTKYNGTKRVSVTEPFRITS